MKKTAIIMVMAILALIAIAACGSQPTGAPEFTPATTTAGADTEWLYDTTAEESSTEVGEAETSADTSAGTSAATTSTAASAPKPTAAAVSTSASPTTARPTTTKAATTKAPVVPPPATAAQTTTTTRFVPPTTTTTTAPKTQPPRTTYTAADYAEIVTAVRNYAEAKTKVKFIWNTTLTYEYARSGMAGFHDVVNLSLYGKEFVINELKYHADLTETHVTGGSGGVPGDTAYYNIVFLDYQGDSMAVLIYG